MRRETPGPPGAISTLAQTQITSFHSLQSVKYSIEKDLGAAVRVQYRFKSYDPILNESEPQGLYFYSSKYKDILVRSIFNLVQNVCL